MEPGLSIQGFKNVAMSEPYFSTHFPRYPVLPGVVIIEAMAQLAGLLIETSTKTEPPRKAILSIVDRVKFKHMVRPGDRVDMRADLVILDEDGARAEVEAKVGEKLVAKTRLTFVLVVVPPEFSELIEKERHALLYALQPHE